MLTLQNILDSDSISTLVAKLNANFQTVSLSNGGPQGIRGEQGIPGLPGKQGATGPSGPIGPAGPVFGGIIPFSLVTGATFTGLKPGLASGIPQSDQSFDFLNNPLNTTWGPDAPFADQVWFDNNQVGWWKYLTQPDPDTSDPIIGGDIEPGTTYSGGNFTTAGWYFYPVNLSGVGGGGGGWVLDKTNYLGRVASGYSSPATITNLLAQEPFNIPNVRMTSKFGTVWISSMDKSLIPGDPGGGGLVDNNDTSLIYSWDWTNNVRLNSGIDRSLFKMSIDGPRYFDNMKARGFRFNEFALSPIIGTPYVVNANPGPAIDVPVPTVMGMPINYGRLAEYFARPLYNVSIDAYSPLLFFSNRNDNEPDNAATLGYYQYSQLPGAGVGHVHLFSTRSGIGDPFAGNIPEELQGSENIAETVWDTRRLITTNQFVNTFPQDTQDYTSVVVDLLPSLRSPVPGIYSQTSLLEWGEASAWHAFQGYHSLFSAEKIIEDATSGNARPFELNEWIYANRQSWYGTALHAKMPNFLDAATTGEQGLGTQELIRSAGMMVRGISGGEGPSGGKFDGVIVYTANSAGVDVGEYGGNPSYPDFVSDNHLLSLPSAYFSHTRNFGIGTVAMDKSGLFEPLARLHSHADWRPAAESKELIEDNTFTIIKGSYLGINRSWFPVQSFVPKRRLKSAAFTIDRFSPASTYGIGEGGVFSDPAEWPELAESALNFSDWDSRGIFNDILIGSVDSPFHEGAEPNQSTFLRPSAAIRYESFNYSGDIDIERARPENTWGWKWKGALRLGASPRYVGNATTPSNADEIGVDSNYQNQEFQIHMVPLSYSYQPETFEPSVSNTMVSGVGIHSLYPRTRLHVYGKNLYQEFRSDEPVTPGLVQANATPSSAMLRTIWQNNKSSNQITIDYLGDSYIYNAAAFDYSYDFTVRPTGMTAFTPWSPNARNNPRKETSASFNVANMTRSTFNSTANRSDLTGLTTGALSGVISLHGGVNNAAWNLDKYIGFNLFRDLLGKGDRKGDLVDETDYVNKDFAYDDYASTWRLGTGSSTDANNGGSAILTDSNGRMGFTFIPDDRNGGRNYGRFEQHGIGTRDIINNVKIIFDSYGNIGIGNAAGYDRDAYPSLYLDPTYGTINYLPNANGAPVDPRLVGPATYSSLDTAPWVPTTFDVYGYATSSVYGVSNTTGSVNAQATAGEHIRMEIAAEKATGRPGHHPEKRGYGYPGWLMNPTGLPLGTGGVVTITDNPENSFANRFFGIAASTLGWGGATHTFTFDNLGRMLDFASDGTSWSGSGSVYTTYPNFALPHPADFGPNGPFTPGGNVVDYPWTVGIAISISINGVAVTAPSKIWIPTGVVAAELAEIITSEGSIESVTWSYDELQPANLRINNFVLGDGYEFMRESGNSVSLVNVVDASSSTTVDIFNNRTASPKLILSFGAVDSNSMTAAGISLMDQGNLVLNGIAPLMKVTTIIESGQDESSLRTYTIPRAANTGGSFMVVTDHMGVTEKREPGLVPLPQNVQKSRLVLEKVVAHEVVRTGKLLSSQTPNPGFKLSSLNFLGTAWDSYPPSYEMLPIHYVAGKPISDLSCEQILTDASFLTSGTAAANIFGAQIRRGLDEYWAVDSSTFTSPYTNREGDTETFEKSEVRYRRLNTNYVMLDFNIDVRALAFDTLRNCIPIEGDETWNSHGQTSNILGKEGFPTASNQLSAYVHSPYAPGHLLGSIKAGEGGSMRSFTENVWVGIDARWVQYLRFSYNVQDDAYVTGVDDPYYWEREFDGGPTFNNWNEYRSWYPGTAAIGPYLNDASPYLDFNYKTGFGAFGYNPSDALTGFEDFPSSPTVGGTGYVQPRDGSPYSPWTTDSVVSGSRLDGCIKYWNGRLNDWFYSRWSQTATTAGPLSGSNWTAQSATALGSNAIEYTPHYPFESAYPGINEFSNGETAINSAQFVYPAFEGAGTSPTTPNNPWINQYAYKLLWKWWQPFNWNFAFDPLQTLVHTLYTEHTHSFDAIVNRAFGDQAWVRSGNMQWKVTPVGKGTATQVESEDGFVLQKSADNVTFVIEVMFDQPIFVTGREIFDYGNNVRAYELDGPEDFSADTTIEAGNVDNYKQHITNQVKFTGANYSDTSEFSPRIGRVSPLSNLTVRGQAIVKYKQTSYNEISNVISIEE